MNVKLPPDLVEFLAEVDKDGKASLDRFPVINPGSGTLRGFKSGVVAEALRIAGPAIHERVKREGVAFLL